MRVKLTFPVILLVVLSLAFTVGASAQDTIKIGFYAPLTGPAASDGKSALHGAELAVEALNAQGGPQIELVVYDDAFSPDEAANVVRRLIEQDKVAGIVSGSYSFTTRAGATIAQDAGIPFVAAYAVAPDVTKTGRWIWRIGELAVIQGRAGAELVFKKLGAKRPGLLIIDNDFGVSLAEAFKSYAKEVGVEIVYEERYPLGESEFRPLIGGIERANVDVLYASGYYSEAAALVRQIYDAGLEVQIVGQEGYDSPTFLELAGEAAEGVIHTTYLDRDSEREVVQNFIKNHLEKYGTQADAVGAACYDAVALLGSVAKAAADLKPETLLAGLEALEGFPEAVTGPIIEFTADREAIRPVGAQIVKDGQFRFFWSSDDEVIIYPPKE